MRRNLIAWTMLLCNLGFAQLAEAADNVQTVGEYFGIAAYTDPGPFQPTTVIGTFTILPGDTAVTISGTFGAGFSPSSAGANVFLGNIQVAQCLENTACWFGSTPAPTPWTYTLSAAQIASLGTGPVNVSVTQTAQQTIVLGTTTMHQVYNQVFAHLAMGPLGSDLWTTAVILNNLGGSPVSFNMSFFQDTGQPLPLALGIFDETHQSPIVPAPDGTSASGTIQAKGSVTIVLSSATFVEGWATLSGPVTGQAVFHRHTSTGAEYEATVPAASGGTEYLVPFDATSYDNGTTLITSLPYITGMALVNQDTANTVTITCAILDPTGASLGSASPITLQPMGHTALQLNSGSGFGGVVGNIGALDCTSNGPAFAVLGLRFLGGNDVTSFAATKIH